VRPNTRFAARSDEAPAFAFRERRLRRHRNKPSQSHGTFTAAATVHFQIWQGGRTEGDIKQAEAALAQRRAELEDLKSQIESDVRNAYLDLHAATSQVEVAAQEPSSHKRNAGPDASALRRGVTDNVEVVQAQEFLTSASLTSSTAYLPTSGET